MNQDALSNSMFWAGALLAMTPLVIGGIAVALWWRTFKRPASEASMTAGSDAARQESDAQRQHGESHGSPRERERAPG